jgi:hypothetical protein
MRASGVIDNFKVDFKASKSLQVAFPLSSPIATPLSRVRLSYASQRPVRLRPRHLCAAHPRATHSHAAQPRAAHLCQAHCRCFRVLLCHAPLCQAHLWNSEAAANREVAVNGEAAANGEFAANVASTTLLPQGCRIVVTAALSSDAIVAQRRRCTLSPHGVGPWEGTLL